MTLNKKLWNKAMTIAKNSDYKRITSYFVTQIYNLLYRGKTTKEINQMIEKGRKGRPSRKTRRTSRKTKRKASRKTSRKTKRKTSRKTKTRTSRRKARKN